MSRRDLTESERHALAEAALAAPSADNRAVFTWSAEHDRLTLHAKNDGHGPYPHRTLLNWMSLGASAVNLELAASGLGLTAEALTTPATDPGAAALVWRFTPALSDAPRHSVLDMAAAIFRRRSNRALLFRGPQLTPDMVCAINAATGATTSSPRLHWLDKRELRAPALRLIRQAEGLRFLHPALHAELYEAVRFDVGWRQTASDGLPPGSLGLPWPERAAFTALRHWPLQRVLNAVGTHHMLAWRGADLPCRLSPHLCVISANGHGPATAFAAGQALQRLWLQCTHLGLAVQVYAASPMYAQAGASLIGERQQTALARGWAALCGGQSPWMVVRIGRAAPVPVSTTRPTAASMRQLV